MKAAGAALVSLGWHKLGYEYVNMDCGWMGGRHPNNGSVYESKAKFPSGMKALADWLHARGLKLGVYSDRGTHDFSGSGYALLLCSTTHPLHTSFAKIFGTFFCESTMRPNPRSGLGMFGHEAADARWMASVGVDYLKVDDMSGKPHTLAGAASHGP